MRNLIGVMTAATLLAGCTAYSPFDSLQTSGALLTTEGKVTVKASFVPGGYTFPVAAPVVYRTAAVVPNLTKSQVDHLKVSLFSVEGETETPLKDANGAPLVKTVSASDLESGLVVGGLTIGKSYRLKATAYRTAEESSPISSEVVVLFKLDKLKPSAELNIQLMDVPFNGQISPQIEITPSGELGHQGPIVIEAEMQVG
ncbi:hypothetical protein J7643_07690 [bacterium]|nr:hypothetical protein [bacterium]